MKRIQSMKWNKCYVTGMLILAVLAVLHGQDAAAGARMTGDLWLTGWYLSVSVAAILLSAGAGAALTGGKWRPEKIYLMAAAGFGLLYLFVLPPLSAPDEIRHYISAYQLSNRILGVSSEQEGVRTPVRAEDLFIEDIGGDYEFRLSEDGTLLAVQDDTNIPRVLGQELKEETYRLIHDYQGLKQDSYTGRDLMSSDDAEKVTANGLALSNHLRVKTTPIAYFAPALGITAARLLHMNTIWLMYLGRICNLFLFAAVSDLAMRRMPFGKEVLFGVGMLPMTLHLAASYSYDTVILAGIFLFTAVCFELAYAAPRVRPADVLLLAVIMAAVGPCKIVYAVFMGLCLLIPVKKFGGWKGWAISAACVLGAWAAAMILINSATVASYAAGTENYIDWANEAGYTLSQLIRQPLHTLRLFYNTVLWEAQQWHLMMLGAKLGNMDPILEVPYVVLLGLTGGLLALAFRKPREQLVIRPCQRLWILTLCLACTGALMFSMLLGWTPVSSPMICGVQGRYFLPVLPIFLLVLKNDTIVLTKNPDRSILYLICCADAYIVMRTFSIVCLRV